MQNNQKILGINTCFESLNYDNFEEYPFSSHVSYLEYDAVLINADHIDLCYEKSSTSPYQNKNLLSLKSSSQIVEDFSLIKEQLIELLKQGKNIYILMGYNDFCYIYTGEKQYSGTGKNRHTTNIVTPFDTYSFIPVDVHPTHVIGERMEWNSNQPYSDFFKKTINLSYYSSYFEIDNAKCLANITGSNKVVASVVEYENGKIFFMPQPYYEDEYENEADWQMAGYEYLQAIFELNSRLSSKLDDYIFPAWSNKVLILNEGMELEKLYKEQKNLEKILTKIEKQKEKIKQIQKYKMLLTASGTDLEEIVKSVLLELDFELFDLAKGRSDIIGRYNEINIVAEIKGVTKSAAEKHAAQLEKWVAQYIEENDEAPKPLLIVNGYCEMPIEKRTEDVFPHQMLKYAESREHALITTTQLLCLYIEIKQNPKCKDDRIMELLSCVGKYDRYQNINDYLCIKRDEE